MYVRTRDSGWLINEKWLSITITPVLRTPTVCAVYAGGVYNGSPHAATATVTGKNAIVLASDGSSPPVNAGTLSYSYYQSSDTTLSNPLSGAPVQVGSYQVVAH